MNKYTYKQFAATRLYGIGVKYSPDGSQIAYRVNTTGQFNLWTMPTGGGFPRQLTMFENRTVRTLAWSPDGKQFAFTADVNYNEMHQVYVIDAGGGWPVQLTDAPEAQHDLNALAWSPDGNYLAYSANDVTPTNMDVILRNMETGETNRPLDRDGLFLPVGWSPDGQKLLIVDVRSNTDQNLLLLDIESGEVTNTTQHEGDTIFFPGPFAPDGSGFYLFTNHEREFTNMAFYDIKKAAWEWVETPDHDIEDIGISDDGQVLYWLVNVDGGSRLVGKNLLTGKPLPIPDLPLGQVDSADISPDGTRLAMVFSTPDEAPNLFELNLKDGSLKRLGQSMLGGVNPADMVQPELITFPSWDGRDIPAWLYKPTVGNGPYAVVLSIHGGPEAQERPRYSYNGFYQYLLNQGFGILAPNIRGSSGYGITYQTLIHRDWGGGELKDIEHAAKYLQSLDWVDSNRLAVFGGSFGGFATLSAVTRLPAYWAAGVDLVGPSNLITFVDSVPPFWKRFMKKWVGDAEEDRDMLLERSPITYVDNVRCPLLVIQGANDPRVVQAESDQMVEKLREKGLEVEYYVDPEEGHGAGRRENFVKWLQMCVDFLEDQMLDLPAAG